jgi:ornithine carbamoyltransferase
MTYRGDGRRCAVVALGGNALLRRGEPPEAANEARAAREAARILAPASTSHRLVITHGNGPQVGAAGAHERRLYMGDARSNMGRSLLVMGAIMGSDVRICGPSDLWPPADVQEIAQERARANGARITVTEEPEEALRGADFIHTDVWVSMGEPKDVWHERVRLLRHYQVNRATMEKTGNPRTKFMHCLPAFHDTNTAVGREIIDETGMQDGLEVTNEVFESPSSIVFDQAENRLHTIKAVLVATLGSG